MHVHTHWASLISAPKESIESLSFACERKGGIENRKNTPGRSQWIFKLVLPEPRRCCGQHESTASWVLPIWIPCVHKKVHSAKPNLQPAQQYIHITNWDSKEQAAWCLLILLLLDEGRLSSLRRAAYRMHHKCLRCIYVALHVYGLKNYMCWLIAFAGAGSGASIAGRARLNIHSVAFQDQSGTWELRSLSCQAIVVNIFKTCILHNETN